MELSEVYIMSLFSKYNIDYFQSELPFPEFKIIHSYRKIGEYRAYVIPDGHYGDVLSISDNYEYTESQLRDIIVHEMIHMYLMHFGIDKKCSHGKDFKNMMNDLNDRYGLRIRTRSNTDEYQLKEGRSEFMKTLCTLF